MIVRSMGSAILPWAPDMQQLQYDLVALHGYVAQLNTAIQMSKATDTFKEQWGTFVTEWNAFKDNASTYSAMLNASDTNAKLKDYQARVDVWRKNAQTQGVTTPGPTPNVDNTPPGGGMLLTTKIILGVLGVSAVAGLAYVGSSYFMAKQPRRRYA